MKAKYASKKESGGKQRKEISNATSNGKQKEVRSQSCDSQDDGFYDFPVFKCLNIAENFTSYSSILSRNNDDAVGMEDIDKLQSELEQMLSAVVLRLQTLHSELSVISNSEGASSSSFCNKKRRLNDGRTSRSSRDDLAQQDDISIKVESMSSDSETDHASELTIKRENALTETEKLTIANEVQNKFWASVEPYVGDITEDNIKDLEDLIQNCDNDLANIKIPPLGHHYTSEWADEDLGEEKQASSVNQVKNGTESEPDSVSLLKRASSLCSDRTPGPFVQRLVSALMEEPSNDSYSKLGDENDSTIYLGKLPLYHTTACFERRIRRELEVVGLLEPENKEDSDEILNEIKSCQEELKAVAATNKEHLKRLLNDAKLEMRRQEIKKKIKVVDTELIEIFKLTAGAKLKKKRLKKTRKEQAWKALKEREKLLKELEQEQGKFE